MNKSARYLLFLILFLITCNLIWYFSGHKPLYWDSADHLSASLDTYKVLKNSSSFPSLLINFLDVSWYYPPLVYWASIPFYAVAGTGEFAGFLEMTFFLILLLISVYRIGKTIYNPETGLFAAFCIAMFPITIQYGREYMLDLPLAAMCAAAVYSLIRTNDFSSRNNCIKFGIIFGLGMLTKWTFILFLAPPVFYFLYLGFLFQAKKSKIAVNFSLSVLTALIIALPWYLRNIVQILTNRLNELERGNLSFLENVFYYSGIIPSQISYVLALLFIIALIIFFKSNSALNKTMPLYWLIGSYVLITLIPFKVPRFSIPVLIPFSLLFSAVVFYGDQKKKKRNRFAVIFSILAIVNFFLFSFVKIPFMYDGYAGKNIWHNEEIIRFIKNDKLTENKTKVNLRVFSREDNLNPSTLSYYSNLNNAGINTLGSDGFPFFTDYFIETQKTKGAAEVRENSPSYNSAFKEIKKYETGDISITLYKIKQDFNRPVSYDSLQRKLISSAEIFFGRYILPPRNIICRVSPVDSSAMFKGKIKSLKISCKEGVASTKLFRGFQYINSSSDSIISSVLPFDNFEFELNGLEFNINSLIQHDKFEILSVSEYKITSLEITNKNLEEFLLKKTAVPEVKISQNLIEIKNGDKFNEISFLISEKNSIPVFKIIKSELMGIPLPSFISNYMFARYNPLFKGTDAVPVFHAGKLIFSQDRISIEN